jgi:predicted ATPase
MFVHRAYIPDDLRPANYRAWPYTVPAVAEMAEHGLTFTQPVTFLVGENGSGKSTIVEAIAEGFNLDSYGGRSGVKRGRPNPQKTPLGEVLRLETTVRGTRLPASKKKGFFLRAETAFNMTENLGGVGGYWDDDTGAMSHGEGFLTIFRSMFRNPGIYLMDEPEAALSFTSCIHLVALMHQLGKSGAQIICATHSPVLAATPGADIIEIGDHGIRRAKWSELDLTDHWRRYLESPASYLRHAIDPD